MKEGRPLLTFEFGGLCLVAFLAVSNSTSFYNLFGHLEALGVAPGLRGLVVGAYSLTAMLLYLVASPFLTARTAPRAMLAGISILVFGGLAYLVVRSFWGLLLLRAFCGAGHFLMGSGAMVLLVTGIPAERSGQAFGLYSVAILAAYGVVPAAMDALTPVLGSPAHGYAAATSALLPAAWIVLRIRRGRRRRARDEGPTRQPERRSGAWANAARPRIALLLLLNTAYFMNWSSLYYLYKGFAERGRLGNVGAFFTVLTAVMIAIRLLAGRLFDRFSKAWLLVASFGIIAGGHLALQRLPASAVPLVGALFGLGLGAGYPALNGLMFDSSDPRFRPVNANLMLFAVQAGSFLGPALGGALVARHGYPGYFAVGAGVALAAAGVSAGLARGQGARRAVVVPLGSGGEAP
jgi:predicted MFS family arabinose efflux permease